MFEKFGARAIHFAGVETNKVVSWEMDLDRERFFELLESPETQEAMDADGANPEEVEMFILDRQIEF